MAVDLRRHASLNAEEEEVAYCRICVAGLKWRRYGTIGPDVAPANDPAVRGHAGGGPGAGQPHRGNVFGECDLFLQPDQSEVIYIAVV